MKKTLFIVLISTLTILILLYFYDKREDILNKKYDNIQDNIHIEYPFFNNQIIDTYINLYLNHYINENNQNLLFIDYDYQKEKDNVELTIYIYKEKNNIINKKEKKFKINLTNNEISTMKENNNKMNYDIYYQKIINNNKPMIALTFDDGPNHNTIKILDILEKYNIKATFFLLGTNIKGNEETIKKMSKLNMEIGNHMYSHKLPTKLKKEEILNEIKKVDNIIYNITKKNPTVIRPSYGLVNNKMKNIIDRPIIIWNIDTLDWKYHNSKRIYNRVINKVKDGDIILMHDIYSATTNSLNLIIPELLKKGYQFVTISELLYNKGIQIEKGKVYYNAK